MKGHVYGLIAVILILAVLFTGLRTPAMLRFGIENIPQKLATLLQKKSIALISNQLARDQKGCRSLDVLLARGANIKIMFVPEHQPCCDSFANNNVIEVLDELTGVPCISLYDNSRMRTVHSQILEKIDLFLFDLPNSGMRHHSCVAVMVHMMQLAQQHNKMFVVLDRPNQLGCMIEGPLVDYKNKSCLAALPIPIRHGLTLGELAWYCNMHVLKHPANLVVVKMAHYDRGKSTPCVNILSDSQNVDMTNSFLELLKEVGPFHIMVNKDTSTIMLPESKGVSRSGWLALAQRLEQLSIVSEYSRCGYNDFAYSGLKIAIDDINQVSLLQVFAEIFNFCRDYTIALSFSDYFNRVIGSSLAKHSVQSSVLVDNNVSSDLNQFYTAARASFMYMPLPQICN